MRGDAQHWTGGKGACDQYRIQWKVTSLLRQSNARAAETSPNISARTGEGWGAARNRDHPPPLRSYCVPGTLRRHVASLSRHTGSRKQPKTTHLTVSRIQYLLFMHFRSSLVYPCNTLQDRSPAACVCAQNNHVITMEGMARWLHSAVLAMLCTKHTKQCLSLCYATGERWLDHAVLDFHVWLEKDSGTRRKIARYTVHSTKEDLSKN